VIDGEALILVVYQRSHLLSNCDAYIVNFSHTSHMLLMKKIRNSSSRSAFTLIEMLVVIGIIAVLAGLAVPAANGVMNKAKKVKTQAALKDIQLGIKNYQMEYGRYPIAGSNKSETPISLDQGSELLDILLGGGNKMNPRKIAFIEPPIAKNGTGGLVGDEGSYGLTDNWGTPLEVIIDADYDNKVDNPDSRNSSENVQRGAPNTLPLGAIVYSLGEDKELGTADDIASWR
jgi:prepilin-type N-terminal cleavage/methylation domain-containing protein